MRRLVALTALLAGCATSSAPNPPHSPLARADDAPDSEVSRAELLEAADRRSAQIQQCYSNYLATFGGQLGADGDRLSAADGPTVRGRLPWEGTIDVEVRLTPDTAAVEVVRVDSDGASGKTGEGAGEGARESSPNEQFESCLKGELRKIDWPRPRTGGLSIKRTYRFQTAD